MRKGSNVLGRTVGVLAALGVFSMGCAGDKGDLNLVQPAYIDKAKLSEGSWYYRRTVVDAPEAVGAHLSIGTGDLFTVERIRWEVTEDYLFAYRDYEYVSGTEHAELEGSDYYGSPVAAYPITKHFDIIRRYNAATGEQTNVIEENARDRLWHERQYMRVDWARNVNPNLDFIVPVDIIATNLTGAGDFYVHEDDAANPYRARIEPDNGYIDYVSNHFVYTDIPHCYYELDFQDYYSCGSGEIKVRHAFVKVDQQEEEGYQPLWYPDSVPVTDEQGREVHDPETGEVVREPIWERFGYYRLERLTYDRERELTESGRLYRIIRFNIWERSLDEEGNEIPYNLREPKPIVYHLNFDFPEELKSAAQEVALEWNQVVRNTVASLQGKSTTEVSDMFVIEPNPCSVDNLSSYLGAKGRDKIRARVAETVGKPLDQESLVHWCSATEYFTRDRQDRFEWPQIGDPRYKMLYWIPNITPAGFAGYGPMLADPVSGRNVTATAYIMGWTIDAAATRGADYIDYMLGNLSVAELIGGEDVPHMVASSDYDPVAQTGALESVSGLALKAASSEHLESLEGRFQRLGGTADELLVPLDNSDHFQERLERIAGTSAEHDWLLRPEDFMVASRGQWRPGMPVDDDLRHRASHIHGVQDVRNRQARGQRFLQERTFCPMADLDGALLGLAERLKNVESRAERRQYIKEQIFKAVALHEIGHNMGLRHNFDGSYDALNYHREFWDIEEQFAGTGAPAEVEVAKEKAAQSEFRYSSIMDYHGKTSADFQGLGLWDNAAIKFGYGQLLETFTDQTLPAGKELRQWRFENDYKKIPAKIGSLDALFDRKNITFDWRDGLTESQVEELTRHEVPYLFCSDEYAGYMPTCRRFDYGANHREIFWASYVRYKNYFIFSNYLRNRLVINWNAQFRGYSAFRDVVTTYQYMYLYRSLQERMFDGQSFFDTDLGTDMATAVADGINMMAEVLAWADPDYYHRCEAPGGGSPIYVPDDFIAYDPTVDAHFGEGPDGSRCDMVDDFFFLPTGEGQPLFLDFTDDFVTWTFTYLGTFWDKDSAIRELTDPFATFFRVNSIEDYRAYSVSPYRLYEPEILNIYANLIQYDRVALSSFVDPSARNIVARQVVDASSALAAGPTGVGQEPVGGLPRIMPPMVRTLQRYAVLYGTALLTSPLDDVLDFSKRTRVTLKGSYDDVGALDDPPEGLDVAECVIPGSGVTYRSMETRDGVSIGYSLVKQCAEHAQTVREAQAFIDDEANASDADGLTEAQRTLSRSQSKLADAEQILQWSRLVHLIYEHGAEL